MIGPLASSVMTVLRLMTPEQIIQMSKEYSSNKGQKVNPIPGDGETTSEVGKGVAEAQAKIIPLEGKKKEEEGKEKEKPKKESEFTRLEYTQKADTDKQKPAEPRREVSTEHSRGGAQRGSNALESIGVLSSGKMQEIEQEEERVRKEAQPSQSVFLLEERQKLSQNNKKMAVVNGAKVYKDKIKDAKDHHVFDENAGVLLDKKLS